MSVFKLANKIHERCCPICNGKLPKLHRCTFDPSLSKKEWKKNDDNTYFVHLAKKALKIIEEAEITEDQFVEYCREFFINNHVINEKIFCLMKEYRFS